MPTISRPAPTRERLQLDDLTADARFQLRQFPGGALFDEGYVRHLLDLLDSGAHFEPLEVVRVTREKKKRPLHLLIDGFHRAEALRRKDVPSVDVLVYEGLESDALLWCLASNARHGRQRTPAECRAAFDRLMNSPAMLDAAVAERKKFGGTERAIAAACGLSNGAVGKYLAEAGWRVDRASGKLCPVSGPKSPTIEARRALVAEAADKPAKELAADLGTTEAAIKRDRSLVRKAQSAARVTENPGARSRVNEEPAAAPETAPEPAGPEPATDPTTAAERALERCQRAAKVLRDEFPALAAGPIGDRLRARAALHKLPVAGERWPVLEELGAVFAEALADLYSGPGAD